MKEILMKSAQDVPEYVLEHYCPLGCENDALRKDTYAVISIQDAHNSGFGFTFSEGKYCLDVLTLYFDDIEVQTEGLTLFTSQQADQIIDFILRNQTADTLPSRNLPL